MNTVSSRAMEMAWPLGVEAHLKSVMHKHPGLAGYLLAQFTQLSVGIKHCFETNMPIMKKIKNEKSNHK